MAQFKVRDIMTTEVVTLSPKDTIRDATKRLAVENITGAPVVDEEYRLVGVVSGNDILDLLVKYDKKYKLSEIGNLSAYFDGKFDEPKLKAAVEEFASTKVSDIMVRTVLTTSPDSSILDLLNSMINMDISRVPVLEKGVLIGIVSRSDIMFAIYKRKI